ncbi:MAG: acetyl-CoA C-acyltransferase [Planctomycetales bacterium]|nr:acetyl-CoA C-acyltransferase [Planctomycetales bacterium]
MAKSDPVVIVGGARTPMAEYVGTPGFGKLADVSALDLGAHAARAALERSKVPAKDVDQVVFGNALQTSNDAIYGARHVGLKAGVPVETPALTVNRLCGSGLQAVVTASQWLLLDEASVVLAGGMENMSQAPHVLRGLRGGIRFGQPLPAPEDLLFHALLDSYCNCFMAQTADNVARKYGVTRADSDAFALRSHRLGAEAVKNGTFAEEIAPVTVTKGARTTVVDTDDHVKPETTAEALAALKPAFGKDGLVTAGNASGIVDGAAALVVTTARRAAERKLEPLGRVVAWSTVGVPPELMGIGPAPAIERVCEKAGWRLGDVDLIEVNEAFAPQYLGVEKALKLDRDRVNVNGGAIALGHPLGATGARLALTLLLTLRRKGLRRGIASACIGGGQGIAVAFERV